MPATSYFYHSVNWAVAQGITNDMTAAIFGPDAKRTRAQIVTFLYRSAKANFYKILRMFVI